MDKAKETTKAWHAANGRRKLMVYFKSEAQRGEWEILAKDQNAPRFARWILEKAELGITGTLTEAGVIDEYRSRIDLLETAVEYERGVANEYRDQVRDLTGKLEGYADLFAGMVKGQMGK